MTVGSEEKMVNLGLLRNRSSKSGVNTLGSSVKKRKTTRAYPARVYISVRTRRLFSDFY